MGVANISGRRRMEERIRNNTKTALIRSFDGSHKIAIIKGIRGRRI